MVASFYQHYAGHCPLT